MTSYHPQYPLLHIDLNQQILDHQDTILDTPKAVEFSSPFPSSASSTHVCPISATLTGYEVDHRDHKESERKIKKEENIKFTNEEPYTLHNYTESKKRSNYSAIKLSLSSEKDTTRDGTGGFSMNWSSTKIRFTRKLSKSSDFTAASSEKHQKDSTIRACTDCNTTRTPLWRSGPSGPKSLCNACGIRQRKARRAMAAAAAEAGDSMPLLVDGSTTTNRKAKRKETSHAPLNKERKFLSKGGRRKNHGMEDGFFPQDEKDAAILLMALSYGMFANSPHGN